MTDTDTPPMTPEMKQALQEQKDKKMREQMGKAYDKANVNTGLKKGGKVKKYAKGGGCELRGKTKGRMV
jgi:malate synthase